jgi:hypothetical protein
MPLNYEINHQIERHRVSFHERFGVHPII